MRSRLATAELFPLQDTPIKGHISEAFVIVTDPAVVHVWVCPQKVGPFLGLAAGTGACGFYVCMQGLSPCYTGSATPALPPPDISLPWVIGLGRGSIIY